MKNIFFIFLISLLFAVTASSQVQYKPFSDDTIKADTNTYKSNRIVKKYTTTVVAFTFTKSDVADSLAKCNMRGSMDNTTFVDLTGNAALTTTTTDGTTTLYVTNPIYLYYDAFLSCATGDTVAVTNPSFIIKED